MARIEGVSAKEAGLKMRVAYYFTRRELARLTGREPERIIEPLELYAHAPGLMFAYGKIEEAAGKQDRVDGRLKVLAGLKAATLTNCEFCIDLGSQVARLSSLNDKQILALSDYRESDLFTDLEKLVLDYATGMSRTPVEVPDALFARLREHFDEAQLVELTSAIAWRTCADASTSRSASTSQASAQALSAPCPHHAGRCRKLPNNTILTQCKASIEDGDDDTARIELRGFPSG